jgi:RNA polymerase sigma-70 factor (ECF subfamily)
MTPAIPISADFLERLRRRDPDALAEAVHEHARPLLRAARALGFAEPEAEDMVQDVFRTFLERLDNFEGRSQLRTWLFGILHRKALERRRAAAMDDRMDPIDEVFESRFESKGKRGSPARRFGTADVFQGDRRADSRLHGWSAG